MDNTYIKNEFPKVEISNNRLNIIQGSLDELVTISSAFGQIITPEKLKDFYENHRPDITTYDELIQLMNSGQIYKLEHYSSKHSNFSF